MTTRTSLRELARRLEVAHSGLAKAIREGRLTAGVRLHGDRIVVTDADAAAAQWLQIATIRAAGLARTTEIRTRRDATACRREIALAASLEMDLAQRRGELVTAEQVRRDIPPCFARVRERLLRVPADVAKRLPNLTVAQLALFRSLVEEAIEEISDESAAAIVERYTGKRP